MIRFLKYYQLVIPLIFFPISFYLWLGHYNNDYLITALLILLPILFSYIMPALGIDKLKLWKINTKYKISGVRPQHGFVLGTWGNISAWLSYFPNRSDYVVIDSLRYALVLGSFLAFWSWIYDIYAIKCGFLVHYTKSAFEKKSAHEIAFDFAPVIFGLFGFSLGISIKIYEVFNFRTPVSLTIFFILSLLFICLIPTIGYIWFHQLKYKSSGLKSYVSEMTLNDEV
ncbi:MAG: hypothetical protein J0M15_05480 [Deltaproteobacteria bacterium]|nr:hypothetical protein [Deltaproteobacteria bacterium]